MEKQTGRDRGWGKHGQQGTHFPAQSHHFKLAAQSGPCRAAFPQETKGFLSALLPYGPPRSILRQAAPWGGCQPVRALVQSGLRRVID